MSETKKRNGEIDLLRFFFAVIIVFFHYYEKFHVGIFHNGPIAVEFFFIVSGFLMARNAKRTAPAIQNSGELVNTTWKYIIKKISIFYPYFIASILLQFILRTIFIQHTSLKTILIKWFSSIPNFTLAFMAVDGDSTGLYVGNTWYLSAMIIAMFILYPILLNNYQRASKWLFPLISIFGFGYMYMKNGSITEWAGWTGFCSIGIIRAVTEIAFGVSLFELVECWQEKVPAQSTSKRTKIFFTVVKWLCYFATFLYAFGFGDKKLNLYAMLFCAVGILLSFSPFSFSIPGNKLTQYLGKISLPIFIFHGFMRHSAKDVLKNIELSIPQYLGLVFGSILLSLLFMYITDWIMKGIRSICHANKKES